MKQKLTPSECGALGGKKSRETIAQQLRQRLVAYTNDPKCCKNCKSSLPYEKRNNKFCSQNCSGTYNGKLRIYNSNIICACCGKIFSSKNANAKFCSNRCQHDSVFTEKFSRFMHGESGVFATARTLRKAVIYRDGYSCKKCGISTWNDQPITLELEHVDGNHENDHYSNLILLCPNCHSQTPTYKAKNKGNGRHVRLQRRKEGKSF